MASPSDVIGNTLRQLQSPEGMNRLKKSIEAKINFNTEKRLELYGMLIAMIRDGLPLDACLRKLYVRMTARKNPIAEIMRQWIKRLDEGQRFSEVIRGTVPDEERLLIGTAERSNDLAAGLEEARNMTLAKRRIANTVRSSMATPIVLLAAIGGMLIWFSTGVLPSLAKATKGKQLPSHLEFLFSASAFTKDYWMMVVAVILGIGMLAMWSMPRWYGRGRPIADYIPPWSIYKNYMTATFLVSLSALLRAGVPLAEAIKYIGNGAPNWMKQHLKVMQRRMATGSQYGPAMDTGMLVNEVADQIMIYSEVSDFDKAILSVGKEAMESGIKKIERLAAGASSIVKMFAAVVIAWLLVSLLSLGSVLQSGPTSNRGGTSSSAGR